MRPVDNQRLRHEGHVKVAAIHAIGRVTRRRRAQLRIIRIPCPHIPMLCGRDIQIHHRPHRIRHARRIGRQIDAAPPQRPVRFIIRRERLRAGVLAADQDEPVIEQPELAVLIRIALADMRVRIAAQIVHPPTRRGDLLHRPPLIVRHPARRRALQHDLHPHAGRSPRGERLGQRWAFQRVALESDARSAPRSRAPATPRANDRARRSLRSCESAVQVTGA